MIACIVVNFGTADLISRYHAGLENLYIVDNFKSDQDRQEIQSVADSLRASISFLDGNLGFGAAVNVGVERAKADGFDRFLIVNPDLRISMAAVTEIARSLNDAPLCMVSPAIDRPDGTRWFEGSVILPWRGMARHDSWKSPSTTPWLTGACLGFTWDQWKRLNGFDPSYFLYWEDVDFTYRWRRLGGDLMVDRRLTAVHDVGGSQAGDGKSLLYTRMVSANRRHFAKRNLPTVARMRWLIATPLFILSLVKNANHSSWKARYSHLIAACQGTFITRGKLVSR